MGPPQGNTYGPPLETLSPEASHSQAPKPVSPSPKGTLTELESHLVTSKVTLAQLESHLVTAQKSIGDERNLVLESHLVTRKSLGDESHLVTELR